jgi:hypothetical protein
MKLDLEKLPEQNSDTFIKSCQWAKDVKYNINEEGYEKNAFGKWC